MTVFKDSEQMQAMLKDLWTHVIKETDVGPKLKEYDVNYKFVINEPNGFVYVDADQVLTGAEANREAVITMELSGDTVHQFWLKQLKLPVALATRKVKTKGPIPKVLKMLPYLKSVHDSYPEYCAKHGIRAN